MDWPPLWRRKLRSAVKSGRQNRERKSGKKEEEKMKDIVRTRREREREPRYDPLNASAYKYDEERAGARYSAFLIYARMCVRKPNTCANKRSGTHTLRMRLMQREKVRRASGYLVGIIHWKNLRLCFYDCSAQTRVRKRIFLTEGGEMGH